MNDLPSPSRHTEPWYKGIGRYEWLVLAIASIGWVFDVYEGQIFNITRQHLLKEILGSDAEIKLYGDVLLGVFLLGGTLGGLAAGSLADAFGRRPIMILTILLYAVFSGLTYFATELWHVVVLRFLVAMGVGGEWAVAASLVAEVFPARARAQASAIFHASSVLGTWAAAAVGMAVGAQWRYAYLMGAIPALLVLWVRASVREPRRWQEAREAARAADGGKQLGSFRELFSEARWRRHALLGMGLGAVGLGTFWGVTVAGQNLAYEMLVRTGSSPEEASWWAKFAYGWIQTAGGGIGLLAFGPLAAWLGRRRAFLLMQLAACLFVPVACFAPGTFGQLMVVLPLFGFLTLSIHAGYAIYFPELFPTRLRATGTSFCFNGGRVLAVPVLFLSGWLKNLPGMDLRLAISLLGLLFLLGALLVLWLPETKDQELPE